MLKVLVVPLYVRNDVYPPFADRLPALGERAIVRRAPLVRKQTLLSIPSSTLTLIDVGSIIRTESFSNIEFATFAARERL